MSNVKGAVLAAIIATFGLWACGDSKGGSSGNICDEESSSYDELACEECNDKLDLCYDRDVCESEGWTAFECGIANCAAEMDASNTCEDGLWDRCIELEDDDAEDACFENGCAAEDAAVNACARAKCRAELDSSRACWERECPGTSECSDFY